MIIVVGSINMDLVARVPHIPAPGETVLGGALAHAFGGELLAGLQAEGVDIRHVRRVPGASGCALISVADGGENAIAVLPGANLQVPLHPKSEKIQPS